MKHSAGFSLIELMVAMTIAGILAGIAVPNIQRWQAKDKFKSQATQVFQMLDSARNNAISEKKCPNGTPSTGWEFKITNDSPRHIQLICNTHHASSVTPLLIEEIIFDPFIEIAKNRITVPWTTGGAAQNNVNAYFFSGSATPRIGDNFSNESFRVPLTSSTGLKKTLCLHRVSGIPSLTENENCE
jgi:prepilin-type N-terminal cleavage/methylation domain-containing protein